jgi:hypothetical protein
LLGHHLADLVAAGPLFRHHLANLIAAGLRARLADVLRAADLLLDAGRDPNLLAACPRRALDTLYMASARAIAAAAGTRIVYPCAWLTHNSSLNWSGNLVRFGFPMSARNRDCLGVRHRLADVIGYLAGAIFPHWFAHRVGTHAIFPDWLADRVAASPLFPHWPAYRVADVLRASFPDWLADRVSTYAIFPHWLADRVAASPLFPHWPAYCVADVFRVRFVNRLAHCVAARASFPHRLAHGVADLFRAGFPARLADRIGPRASFPHRPADRVADLAGSGFRDVLGAVNHAIFAHAIPARLVARDFFAVVFDTANRLHDRVTLHLATRCTAAVTRHSAESSVCLGRCQ